MKSSRCPPADEWIMSRALSLFSVAVRKCQPGAAWGGKELFQLTVQGQELKGTRRKKTKYSVPPFMVSKKSTSKFPRGWSPIAIVTQMFQLLPLTLPLKVPSPVTIPPRAVFQGKQQFASLLTSGSFTPAFGFNRLIIV